MIHALRKRKATDAYSRLEDLGRTETERRGRWFGGMAETAEIMDWPCSATAPFRALTEEESSAIWNGSAILCQRVFAPTLTKTEQDALRQNAKELHDWAQKAFKDQKV